MSDQNNLQNEELESTIFSDPAHFSENKEEKKEPKNNLLKKAIATILAVAVLATGTFFAFKYIPQLKADTPEQNSTIRVTATAENEVKSITVHNSLGKVKLNAGLGEANGESTVIWSVDGVKSELTSTSSIAAFAKNIISLNAFEKMPNTDKDFGFNDKSTRVTVVTASSEYSVTIGKTAPGDMGYYCKTTLDSDNVYVINGAPAVSMLTATALDFASTDGFKSIKESNNESCFSGEEITQFDYIELSGKKHKSPIKIVEQEDEGVNAYFAFKMVKPAVRICDNDAAQAILTIFSKGFASEGAYAYATDSASLKKFGLDNPDYVVTLSLKGKAHTLKFAKVDENYAAFVDGKTDMIQKISLSAISFATNPVESYYSTFITLENLKGLKQMRVDTPKGSFTFDIKFLGDSEPDFEITYKGKKLDLARFKDYYGSIIGMTPISYESDGEKETVKVTFVHSGEFDDTVLKFKKSEALRYLAEIDGVPIGQVTSTVVEKFINDTEKIANGTY